MTNNPNQNRTGQDQKPGNFNQDRQQRGNPNQGGQQGGQQGGFQKEPKPGSQQSGQKSTGSEQSGQQTQPRQGGRDENR